MFEEEACEVFHTHTQVRILDAYSIPQDNFQKESNVLKDPPD